MGTAPTSKLPTLSGLTAKTKRPRTAVVVYFVFSWFAWDTGFPTADEQTPFRTTLKPWVETILCRYLPGNRLISGFLGWCDMDFATTHCRASEPRDFARLWRHCRCQVDAWHRHCNTYEDEEKPSRYWVFTPVDSKKEFRDAKQFCCTLRHPQFCFLRCRHRFFEHLARLFCWLSSFRLFGVSCSTIGHTAIDLGVP